MPVKFDAEEFASALRQVKPVASASSVNSQPKVPLTTEEWQQSEEFRVRLITARTKLKLMRDRSDALRDSLQRFRAQQSIANRA